MPDLLLPINGHLFTPAALQKAVDEAIADHPDKANVLKGTVDASGASVVLALGSSDGAWKVQTAFTHDWQGSNSFGVSGSVAW